jgi:AraC-like DNA-binding protein
VVICTVGKRRRPIGWTRDVFDLRIVARSPRSAKPFVPAWSERILESSLLRAPEVLARAVGVYGPVPDVALKQVSQIDLYFTLRRALHLVEVKKPSEYKRRHLRAAAAEVVKQWEENAVWLRPEGHKVHLWILCPIDPWKPQTAESEKRVAEVVHASRTRLAKRLRATFGVLRYAVYSRRGRTYLKIWRQEPAPRSGRGR